MENFQKDILEKDMKIKQDTILFNTAQVQKEALKQMLEKSKQFQIGLVKKVEMKSQQMTMKEEQLNKLKLTLSQNEDDLNFLINQKSELVGIQQEKEAELALAEEAQVTAFKALGEPLVASPTPRQQEPEQQLLSDSDSEPEPLSDSEPEPLSDSEPEPDPSLLETIDELIIRKIRKDEPRASSRGSSSLRRRPSIKSSSDLETIDEDEIVMKKSESENLTFLKSSNETEEDEVLMKKLLKEEEEERIFRIASEKLMKKKQDEENMKIEAEIRKLEQEKKRIDEESRKQKEDRKRVEEEEKKEIGS